MNFTAFLRDNAAVLLLAGAAAGWYVASLVGSDALAGGKLALRRRIIGQWIPIITMALIATLAQRTEVAIGVLFATSVAALSLVLGIVTLSHEMAPRSAQAGGFPVIETPNSNVVAVANQAEPSHARSRRVWAFVLPAALIALLAGFSGRLAGMHALLLAVQGLVILSLWTAPNELDEIDRLTPDRAHLPPGRLRRAIEMALAVVVALLASWAGVYAVGDLSREIGLVSGGFVAAMLVSPALVLPMIGSGMALARANLYSGAISASVGIALLNLCFGLPLVIGVWYAKPLWQGRTEHLTAMIRPADPAPAAEADEPEALETIAALDAPPDRSIRYPMSVWRVDTVILILLGLILLPLAVGRWLPGRFEGVLLVFIYVIYMGLTTWAARV